MFATLSRVPSRSHFNEPTTRYFIVAISLAVTSDGVSWRRSPAPVIKTLLGSTTTWAGRFKFPYIGKGSAFFGLFRPRRRRVEVTEVAERCRPARRLITVHRLRVCGLGVLGEVDAGRLVLGADPEAHRPIDHLAEDV